MLTAAAIIVGNEEVLLGRTIPKKCIGRAILAKRGLHGGLIGVQL